jgi:cytochrome c553
MKKYTLAALSLLASYAIAYADMPVNSPEQNMLGDARKLSAEFVQKLGGILKKQLESSGTESALSVCKDVAPAMSAQYSNDKRIVKRVSLKPRNSTIGVADEWEADQLKQFDMAAASGKPAAEIETHVITDEQDGRWFRYMKAIPTQAMCLQCHGGADNIQPSVQNLLKQLYPNDLAVGYKVGEIRGAISVKEKFEQ